MKKLSIRRIASLVLCLATAALMACGGKAPTRTDAERQDTIVQASPEADALLDRFEAVTQRYVKAIEDGDKAAYEAACDDYLLIRDSITEVGRTIQGAQAQRLQQLRTTLEDAHDKAFSAFTK